MENLTNLTSPTDFLTEDWTPMMPGIQYPVPEKIREVVPEVKFVNLTPHTVNIIDINGEEVSIPASGQQARIEMSIIPETVINNVQISKQTAGNVTGLPELKPDTLYIVSALVAQAVKHPNVCSPDTGKSAIRENGLIKAVTGLVFYA